jgi:hypothetical protein
MWSGRAIPALRTKQIFENLRAALATPGASFGDIVKLL